MVLHRVKEATLDRKMNFQILDFQKVITHCSSTPPSFHPSVRLRHIFPSPCDPLKYPDRSFYSMYISPGVPVQFPGAPAYVHSPRIRSMKFRVLTVSRPCPSCRGAAR